MTSISGGVDVNQVTSTHFDILLEPAVKVLADQLRSHLDRSNAQKTMHSRNYPKSELVKFTAPHFRIGSKVGWQSGHTLFKLCLVKLAHASGP
jgi:hypothetical protein